MSSIYEINKGINKPVEFKGFKGQYITYLAAGLVALLVLFAIGYIAGVSVYLCLVVVAACGFVLFSWVYRLSHKYGEHGLMVAAAFRQVPSAIICRNRNVFVRLLKRAHDDSDNDRNHGGGGSPAATTQRQQ
ncbi:DUF4133 domain-containing protein [Chitinophaga filiformis]|uniref:DUF4133 domain-containing protein n=1 Tax=Chitinophaga filiformis TaxID=104663 RepID=A0ABY4HYM1_CHIFI|nr:DUF4133 domain-containing protein [Chitinophaga filiformis]UPK68033.1 DUF4133 domain-containing protein [Chitinophaga filiformis]